MQFWIFILLLRHSHVLKEFRVFIFSLQHTRDSFGYSYFRYSTPFVTAFACAFTQFWILSFLVRVLDVHPFVIVRALSLQHVHFRYSTRMCTYTVLDLHPFVTALACALTRFWIFILSLQPSHVHLHGFGSSSFRYSTRMCTYTVLDLHPFVTALACALTRFWIFILSLQHSHVQDLHPFVTALACAPSLKHSLMHLQSFGS